MSSAVRRKQVAQVALSVGQGDPIFAIGVCIMLNSPPEHACSISRGSSAFAIPTFSLGIFSCTHGSLYVMEICRSVGRYDGSGKTSTLHWRVVCANEAVFGFAKNTVHSLASHFMKDLDLLRGIHRLLQQVGFNP